MAKPSTTYTAPAKPTTAYVASTDGVGLAINNLTVLLNDVTYFLTGYTSSIVNRLNFKKPITFTQSTKNQTTYQAS